MKRGWIFLIGGFIIFWFVISNQRGWADQRYTVKPGDSLYSISKSFGLSVEAIKKTNHLEGDRIWPKQTLRIPTEDVRRESKVAKKGIKKESKSSEGIHRKPNPEMETYVVQKGESLYSISKKYGVSIEEIKRINHLSSTLLKIAQALKLPSTQMEDAFEENGDLEERNDLNLMEEALREEGGKEKQLGEPLGKWSSPEERNLFIKVVKTFLGVPYRLGGSTLKGIDCSAFVKKIYQIFNVDLPRTAREQIFFGKRVKREELEEGDLVFFKTRRANGTHVGIYVGNNEFVHASSWSKEVKIDSLEAPYFDRRFLGGVRIKELGQES